MKKAMKGRSPFGSLIGKDKLSDNLKLEVLVECSNFLGALAHSVTKA